MSRSFSSPVPPQCGQDVPSGSKADAGSVNQTSALFCSMIVAICAMITGSASTRRHELQVKAGMGTPQTRCRERHQSGRLAIIPLIRSFPQGGIHLTRLISAKACWRKSLMSIETNHCSVARKITAVLQRQQWGYEWAKEP